MIISTPLEYHYLEVEAIIPNITKNKSTVIGFAFNRYNYILFRTKFINNPTKYSINYSLNEKQILLKK